MYVDFNCNKLAFRVNDGEQRIAFTDLAKDEYRAALSIKNTNDKWELLSYNHEPNTNFKLGSIEL